MYMLRKIMNKDFMSMRDMASVKEVIGQIRRAECTSSPGGNSDLGEKLHGLENVWTFILQDNV